MKAGELAEPGTEPHILIGVHPALTKSSWERFGRRPFVFEFTARTLWTLGRPIDRFGHEMICPLPVKEFIGHLCYHLPNDEALIGVRTDLERARQHFRLDSGAPLRVAIAGNYSSMCRALSLDSLMGVDSLEDLFIQASLRDRKLACLVGSALEQIGGVELIRLPGNIAPDLRSHDYDRVVTDVRSLCDERQGDQLAGGVQLKLPVQVEIYWRRRGSEWRLLDAGGPQSPAYSDTEWLIQRFLEFKIDSAGNGGDDVEGVLVKLLGTHPSRHSPADSPILTPLQHQAAQTAGISAILLDARHGILIQPGDGLNLTPVYGV